jgi:hypothetical protein
MRKLTNGYKYCLETSEKRGPLRRLENKSEGHNIIFEHPVAL